jgi:hypothetical protein
MIGNGEEVPSPPRVCNLVLVMHGSLTTTLQTDENPGKAKEEMDECPPKISALPEEAGTEHLIFLTNVIFLPKDRMIQGGFVREQIFLIEHVVDPGMEVMGDQKEEAVFQKMVQQPVNQSGVETQKVQALQQVADPVLQQMMDQVADPVLQ